MNFKQSDVEEGQPMINVRELFIAEELITSVTRNDAIVD